LRRGVSVLKEGMIEFVLIQRVTIPQGVNAFFIDFIVDSIFPLLWGWYGNDFLCKRPHCCANWLNLREVICGLPSDQMTSGMAVLQNACHRAVTIWVVVVLCLIGNDIRAFGVAIYCD